MPAAASRVGRGLHAPLFEQLVHRLEEDRRHVVLDCGAARAGTIDLLSRYRCRLDILDLAVALPELTAQSDPQARSAVFARRLPKAQTEPAELVFCWNLLNYLKPADVSALIDGLLPLLAPAARLHALIEYSSPLMPASPGHWVPDQNGRLFADQEDAEQIPAPRYSPKALERMMPRLKPERSMLLGNGLREHLFRMA